MQILTNIENEIDENGNLYMRAEFYEPNTKTKAIVIMAGDGYASAELHRGDVAPFEVERIEKNAVVN